MPKLMPNPIFMDEYEIIRATLVRARANSGVSQPELARRIGRSPSFISMIEIGQRKLELLESYYVFEALGLDPAIVVGAVFDAITDQRRGSEATASAA
jgi:transcriptional regulator with XRE-family HTH domain